MPTADRREFLRAAGLAGLAAGPLAAAPGPKAAPDSLALPPEADPPLPVGAVARLGSRRMRVGRYVHGLRFSPTGKLLVVADREAIWGWEAKTGRVAFRFKYPGESITDGAADDDCLALVVRAGNKDGDCQLRRYAIPTGVPKGSVPLSLGNANGVSVGPAAGLVAHATGGTVRAFDGTTGRELWSNKAEGDGATFFPDGRRLVVGTGAALRVHDARTGQVVATLPVRVQPGQASTLPVGSADGKWLAAMADRNQESVTVWEVASGRAAHTFRSQGKPLAFTPDGKQLFTASPDGVTVWDLTSGSKARGLDLGSPGQVSVSPDGMVIAAHAEDAIWLYDAATGELLPHSADPPGVPKPLWFAGGRVVGRLTAWGGWASWDPKGGPTRLTRMTHTGALAAVGLSADGARGLYRDDKAGEFHVREVATGRVVRKLKSPEESTSWDATPDGRTVVVTGPAEATVIDTRTDARRTVKMGRTAGAVAVVGDSIHVGQVALTPDGRAAAWATDGTESSQAVALVDLRTGKVLGRFSVQSRVGQVALAPDGRRLAVVTERHNNQGGVRGVVFVFDAGSPLPVVRIAPAQDDYRAASLPMAFSPDGRTLARPSQGDAGITLWESVTGKSRHTFALGGEVHALAFSPDGRTLAASCGHGPVILWDVLGDRTSPAAAPDKPALDRAWDALASSDAEAAFRAVRLLARFPERSLPYLAGRLAPAPAADRAKVRKLIDDLNDDNFHVREGAQRQLLGMVEWASGDLQAALDAGPSAEARQRLEELLRRSDQLTPDRLRWVRAAEAVEWAGTPAAQQLLKTWADGGHGAKLAAEARRGLDRLGK